MFGSASSCRCSFCCWVLCCHQISPFCHRIHRDSLSFHAARLFWRQYQIALQFHLLVRASFLRVFLNSSTKTCAFVDALTAFPSHWGVRFFWMRGARWITLTRGHRPLYSILQGMATYLGRKRVERVIVACLFSLFSVVVPVFARFSFYVRCLRAEVQCLEHTWSIQLL